MPQDRAGRFSTELFERYQRSEKALVAALAERPGAAAECRGDLQRSPDAPSPVSVQSRRPGAVLSAAAAPG